MKNRIRGLTINMASSLRSAGIFIWRSFRCLVTIIWEFRTEREIILRYVSIALSDDVLFYVTTDQIPPCSFRPWMFAETVQTQRCDQSRIIANQFLFSIWLFSQAASALTSFARRIRTLHSFAKSFTSASIDFCFTRRIGSWNYQPDSLSHWTRPGRTRRLFLRRTCPRLIATSRTSPLSIPLLQDSTETDLSPGSHWPKRITLRSITWWRLSPRTPADWIVLAVLTPIENPSYILIIDWDLPGGLPKACPFIGLSPVVIFMIQMVLDMPPGAVQYPFEVEGLGFLHGAFSFEGSNHRVRKCWYLP